MDNTNEVNSTFVQRVEVSLLSLPPIKFPMTFDIAKLEDLPKGVSIKLAEPEKPFRIYFRVDTIGKAYLKVENVSYTFLDFKKALKSLGLTDAQIDSFISYVRDFVTSIEITFDAPEGSKTRYDILLPKEWVFLRALIEGFPFHYEWNEEERRLSFTIEFSKKTVTIELSPTFRYLSQVMKMTDRYYALGNLLVVSTLLLTLRTVVMTFRALR